jgi:RNA polymerase sigma-70 factor (ECF subfamily)
VSLDDRTLVVRAQEGDVRAFEALARRHEAALYRTAVRVIGDPAEAEDAVQEALLDAWRHLEHFRGEARFSTWMYRLVTNRRLGPLRRRRSGAVGGRGQRCRRVRLPRTRRPARP